MPFTSVATKLFYLKCSEPGTVLYSVPLLLPKKQKVSSFFLTFFYCKIKSKILCFVYGFAKDDRAMFADQCGCTYAEWYFHLNANKGVLTCKQ